MFSCRLNNVESTHHARAKLIHERKSKTKHRLHDSHISEYGKTHETVPTPSQGEIVGKTHVAHARSRHCGPLDGGTFSGSPPAFVSPDH